MYECVCVYVCVCVCLGGKDRPVSVFVRVSLDGQTSACERRVWR